MSSGDEGPRKWQPDPAILDALKKPGAVTLVDLNQPGGVAYFPDPQPQPDAVNHPSHYTQHPSGIECIQITEHMSFTMGNAMKYLWRADLKNGVEDLKKAVWYIQREIAKREKA